jgi:hypothetical protein
MFFRHNLDKLIYPVVAVVVLLIVSYRPKYSLRSEMPSTFFSSSTKSEGQKKSVDERIAWAYWESAQMEVQWKYPHGHPLPPDAPPEFRVNAQALGSAASDPATRTMYWHRLQQIWYSPDTWKSEYEFDLGWAGDPLTSSGQWLRDHAERLFTLH